MGPSSDGDVLLLQDGSARRGPGSIHSCLWSSQTPKLHQHAPRCRSLPPPRGPARSLDLPSSPVQSLGQKSPFPSEGCPDFSFLPRNAEVELSPTKCFVVLHLLVCFIKERRCEGRALVAPVCWEMEGLLPEMCPGLLGKSFRRSCPEESVLDVGSRVANPELGRFAKTPRQLKLQRIIFGVVSFDVRNRSYFKVSLWKRQQHR